MGNEDVVDLGFTEYGKIQDNKTSTFYSYAPANDVENFRHRVEMRDDCYFFHPFFISA